MKNTQGRQKREGGRERGMDIYERAGDKVGEGEKGGRQKKSES